MFGFLKNLFSSRPATDYGQLLAEGGVIVDVRTRNEYAGGHVKGSLNFPLNELGSNLGKLRKDHPIITCCASGMRSGAAKSQLIAKGYTRVYNGGSWYNLKKYEK